MSSLIYFFKESLRGFVRNLSTSVGSIITIFLSLLIIGVFLIGGVMVNGIVESVENEVTITVYVADDASQTDVEALQHTIEGLSGVSTVAFTTKEQALENFRQTSNSDIIDSLDGQNPLPASIDVELADPQLVESVATQIQEDSVFATVCDNPDDPSDSIKYGQKTVERLFALTSYMRYIGIALIALLIFIALVFISNTIRLAILARRKEIAIMRLVGASNGFIRGPFLMEGALHAVIGSFFAIGILQLLRHFGLPKVQGALAWLPINIDNTTFLAIYLALFLFGLLIGLIGSAMAMRKYLKV